MARKTTQHLILDRKLRITFANVCGYRQRNTTILAS
jgi:hypothetical protein